MEPNKKKLIERERAKFVINLIFELTRKNSRVCCCIDLSTVLSTSNTDPIIHNYGQYLPRDLEFDV